MTSTTSSEQAKWSVYLIRTRLDTLYCGITTDVNRRFQEHSNGAPKGAKALRGKGPLELVFQQEIGDKSLASKIEARIKKLSRSQKNQIIQLSPDLKDLV